MGDDLTHVAAARYSSGTSVRKFRIIAVHGAIEVAAIGCLAYLAAHYSIAPLFTWAALLWLVLRLIAGYSVIRTFGAGVPHNISVGFTVSGAILVLFNPLVAALLIMLGSLNERDFRRQRTLAMTLHNRAMFVVVATVGAMVYRILPGGEPSTSQPLDLMAHLGAMVLAYFIVNSFLVHASVSALNDEPFLLHYPFKGDLLFGYLFQGFIAMLLVFVASAHQALAILVVGPLWGIRFSLEKIVELREINEQLVHSFADALDLRDHDTAGHTRRVATLARLIGQQLGLSRRQLNDIYSAGSLHDLGKIGIPDSILLKPSGLARDEWEEMKKHPVTGAALLAPYRHLQNVTAIMRHHHEKFDGTGYPDGVSGGEIPIGARVIAVADTFMVITDGRQYQAARTVDQAIAEINRCTGTQFDPQVVEAFLKLDPRVVLQSINTVDYHDNRPVLEALRPNPVWARVLGFKAA
jgi:HD-GYP domain-containing protein (c-di-GMP phosphodiesterase class II)